jgi:hypothetical protein
MKEGCGKNFKLGGIKRYQDTSTDPEDTDARCEERVLDVGEERKGRQVL